jgi:sortase (surface protein transpeptidase)
MPISASRMLRALPYLLIGLGVGLAVYALAPRHHVQPRPSTPGSQSTPAVSEKKPAQSAIDAYTVAKDLPRYLAIPSIGVPKSRVLALGANAKGQIAAPDNLYDIGWYKAGGKPGQAGAMFMYGHVSGWRANGIFYDLSKLRAGDTISVTRGDNKAYTFKIAAIKHYPVNQVDMNAVLSPVTRGREGLNLMTCAGELDEATGEFSERLVVFASLAGS